MFFDILTLFPEMFEGPLNTSILGKAQKKKLIDINIVDIRNFTNDKHNTADDYPYGGGAGMVLKIEPVSKAIKSSRNFRGEDIPVIFLSPQGKTLDQDKIKHLSKHPGLILLCGHYEGIDERIRENFVTEEISIGDYVLTGGELPAMVIIDAVARLIPGVLGDEKSYQNDSFFHNLLDYPQYTRPRTFRGMNVPDILLSGNHGLIKKWRKKHSLKRTLMRRPDLIKQKKLTDEELKLLEEIRRELKNEKNG